MDEIKIYEFMLKLNTYLNRVNVLAGKLIKEEQKLGAMFVSAQTVLPQEVFEKIFSPTVEVFEKRESILKEIQESDDELEKSLQELYSLFKGTVQ